MTSIFFVVPANGRVARTEVCLRQLCRTCDTLAENGLRASAVVIADDENLDVARACGFATVERNNDFLGMRFNDGYEAVGLEGVDFAIPCGSDDFVHPDWVAAFLPAPDEIRCSRLMSMVSEDGNILSRMHVAYTGGHGIRIIPRQLLERVGFRPADEWRNRAVDTSTLRGLSKAGQPRLGYVETDPLDVVDWKSRGEQLNTFVSCSRYALDDRDDPFDVLASRWPTDALDAMRAVYRVRERVAA